MVKTLFVLADLCILTAISYMGVNAFYKTALGDIFAALPDKTMFAAPAENPEDRRPSFAHYQSVTSRNLFKAVVEDPEKRNRIDLKDLEQTDLELTLRGTVITDDGPSYAVIQHKNQKGQQLYMEGDSIDGAAIKVILKEQVILAVGPDDEILEMEKASSSGPRTRKTSEDIPHEHPLPFEPVPGNNQEIVIHRNQIHDTVQNVHELMTQAQINPHFKEGEAGTAGLMMSAIKSDSLFGKMGLRDRDILLGIDGKPIKSFDDALDLYHRLKNSDRLNLQVERSGQTVELQYAIE